MQIMTKEKNLSDNDMDTDYEEPESDSHDVCQLAVEGAPPVSV